VETSEDFGAQGELPMHPELLDWLATELVERKWDLKVMHKLIVMSATYRQSSKVSRDLHERDPYNRLLARGSRFRLDAEMVETTPWRSADCSTKARRTERFSRISPKAFGSILTAPTNG